MGGRWHGFIHIISYIITISTLFSTLFSTLNPSKSPRIYYPTLLSNIIIQHYYPTLLTVPSIIHLGMVYTTHHYYIVSNIPIRTPNALVFLPFRKKATLPGKRCLLMVPGDFTPAPAILVCIFIIHVSSRYNCPQFRRNCP